MTSSIYNVLKQDKVGSYKDGDIWRSMGGKLQYKENGKIKQVDHNDDVLFQPTRTLFKKGIYLTNKYEKLDKDSLGVHKKHLANPQQFIHMDGRHSDPDVK